MEPRRRKHAHDMFKGMRKLSFCFVVLSFISFQVCGQNRMQTFTAVAPDIIANTSVRCFHKDGRGYMWIGTAEGLVRYDGTKAYRYLHAAHDKSSLSHSSVNVIAEDARKRIWIGTAQGLCMYNQELDNFINIDSISGNRNFLSNRYITDLEFDKRGRIWVGTHSGGVNIYDPLRKEFIYLNEQSYQGVLPATNFIGTLRTVNDQVWCGSRGGLMVFDANTNKRIDLHQTGQKFAQDQICEMLQDNAGNIWIATTIGEIIRVVPRNGYYSFQQVVNGSEFGESSSRVLAMNFDNKGNLLIGGEASGLNILDTKTSKVSKLNSEVPGNSIVAISMDREGLIWLGSSNNGAFVLDNSIKKFQHNFNDGVVAGYEARGFAEDALGTIWIAYNGIGIARMDRQSRQPQPVDRVNRQITNKNVSSVICDRHGILWLGTLGKGVYRIDPARQTVTNYTVFSEGFGNDKVLCLYEDWNGTVWAGTLGSGLFYFDPKGGKFISATEYNKPNHIPNTAYVTCMMEDSHGTFWVGTMYGLYELSRAKGSLFNYRSHVPNDTVPSIRGGQVQSVLEDSNKNLWVGTSDNGLSVRFNGESNFVSFGIKEGMASNSISSMLMSKHGQLWMSTNRGLSKMDVAKKTFQNFSKLDGLNSNTFYPGASFTASNGEFFFGSNTGFERFFPDSIQVVSSKPTLYLSDIKINNQSVVPGAPDSPLAKHISLTSEIMLSYDQRSFVIDFVALGFRPSSRHTYCYKLDGFDEDWKCSGEESATYTNIDPGTYVFMVKAANRDGVWTTTPVTLKITIEQVFWKTWWAVTAYVLFVVGAVYMLMRIRIERIKMRNQLNLERIAREQEHELSELKTQFFTNISHEFRTPLTLVLMPLESLMNTTEVPSVLRERIFTAHRNGERMMRLVNELMDFNKLDNGGLTLHVRHGEILRFIHETSSAFNEMAGRRNIRFSISSTDTELMGWYDHDKLERIIFNLLSNAFKFTPDGGEINVNINSKHSIIGNGALCRCAELVIVDNGVGIAEDELPHIFDKFYQAKSAMTSSSPGTGIGLSLTKALVELHQGRITAESIPDKSTTFTILLPIDASAYAIDEVVETPADVVYTKLEIEAAADIENVEGDRRQVLIVEDNIELLQYLVVELKKEFIVLEATNGEEGLALAIEKIPDLIISDVMMPKKNGIEFCDAIKGNINTSHIPFILLTAKTTAEDQIHGINTGADLYITKPFNISVLNASIRQIIASRQKLYTRFSQDVYLMPGKVASNELDQAFLQKAIDYIVNNLTDSQLSVDSIAGIFNVSRMQVYRKIKALTGKSVVEFIRIVRMKEAVKLMDTHKFTLAEIAFQTGFNSSSYFTRCFKEEYGKTPSEYLQQL